MPESAGEFKNFPAYNRVGNRKMVGSSRVGCSTRSAGKMASIPRAYISAIRTIRLAVGDFTGDGTPDLVVGNGQSDTVAVLMNGIRTSTSMSGPGTPSVLGQPTTVTATVTGLLGTPAGTASFFDGTTLLQTVTVGAGGGASFTSSALGVGTHDIRAEFSDLSGNYNPSSSGVRAQQVNPADTTTSLAPSGGPSVYGQTVSFTATVTAAAPSTATPVGVVSFYDGATLLGTSTLSGGLGTLSTSALGAGTHAITAVFDANAGFNASPASNPVSQAVTPAATTVSLGGTGSPSTYGQNVTYTATIHVTAPGAGTPTGSVTFFDAGIPIGTVTASSGVATLPTSTLAGGSHSVTAIYNGSANYAASPASGAVAQQVNQATTSISLAGPGSSSTFGQDVALSATVSALFGTVQAGTVTFLDAGTALGTVSVFAGQAVLNTTALLPGSHSLTATYSGTADYTGAGPSDPVTQQVDGPPTLGGVPGFVQMDEQTPLTFTATDTNAGPSPAFSLIGAPAGATIDASSGVFAWTPTEAQGPGTFAFTVRLADGSTVDDLPIIVAVNEVNTAPTLANVPAGVTTAAGSPVAFTATAADPDLIDGRPNTLTFSLVGGPAGAVIDPDTGAFSWAPGDFNPVGTYTFKVRVSDDGVPSLSDSLAITIAVKPAAVVNGDLLVGGTAGNDVIAVAPSKDLSQLIVTVNKAVVGTFPTASVTGKVVVHGLSGNDTISVSSKVTKPAWLFGEAGNDKLTGGGGNNLLVGGGGNDTLSAKVGTNVLIGGNGADKLTGGSGGDLLIAGPTIYDADLKGLTNIVTEWTSGNSYTQRVTNLTNGVSGTMLMAATVGHDGVKDTLTGKKGADWFLVSAMDKVTDLETKLGEVMTTL